MNYMGINKCDLANGPGVRVSLFVSGCELRCPFCQNKEAWETNAGHLFGENELASIIEFLKPDYISGFSIFSPFSVVYLCSIFKLAPSIL